MSNPFDKDPTFRLLEIRRFNVDESGEPTSERVPLFARPAAISDEGFGISVVSRTVEIWNSKTGHREVIPFDEWPAHPRFDEFGWGLLGE
jgi:hypothetical protein